MKQILYNFGKKSLAVVVAGFLATGLGLASASTAQAEEAYDCPVGMSCGKKAPVKPSEPEPVKVAPEPIRPQPQPPRPANSSCRQSVNPDGSITTRGVDAKGSNFTYTVYPDGSTASSIVNPDGSTHIYIVHFSGSTLTYTLYPGGTIIGQINYSNGSISHYTGGSILENYSYWNLRE